MIAFGPSPLAAAVSASPGPLTGPSDRQGQTGPRPDRQYCCRRILRWPAALSPVGDPCPGRDRRPDHYGRLDGPFGLVVDPALSADRHPGHGRGLSFTRTTRQSGGWCRVWGAPSRRGSGSMPSTRALTMGKVRQRPSIVTVRIAKANGRAIISPNFAVSCMPMPTADTRRSTDRSRVGPGSRILRVGRTAGASYSM